MDETSNNLVDDSVGWGEPRHNEVLEYQQLDSTAHLGNSVSYDGSVADSSHYAGLQTLQQVFVTVQQVPNDDTASYQTLQNDINSYQSAFISSDGTASFERISSADVDYAIATDEDALALDNKQHYVQVPFILGGASAQTTPSQYCVGLSSYLQNIGSSIINANLPRNAADQISGTTGNIALESSCTASDSLLHMISPSFTTSSLNELQPSAIISDNIRQPVDSHSISGSFNASCNMQPSSRYVQVAMGSQLVESANLQQNRLSMDVNHENKQQNVFMTGSVPFSSGQLSEDSSVVLQQLLVDGDDEDMETTNSADAATHNETVEIVVTRKSARIANKDRTPSPQPIVQYISKPYNTMELWCEDCQTSYLSECPRHKLQPVSDRVILSRAWASLPPNLQIFRLMQAEDNTMAELGVFAKRSIPRRTQFGPFIAPTVDSVDSLTSRKFVLLIDRDGPYRTQYYDATDENLCNWMMFVRPAKTCSEQNLVAYQFGNDVYFSSICNIEPRQELKVWYAAHYAERLQASVLQKPEEPAAVEMQDLPWSCYECPQKFRTAALLQNHLNEHDDDDDGGGGDNAALDVDSEDNSHHVEAAHRRRSRKQDNKLTLPQDLVCQAPAAEATQNNQSDANVVMTSNKRRTTDGRTEFQSWKKRKTSMYLKMKKYKEPINRSIKALTNKSRTGAIGIGCTECDVVFEKRELLKLHMITHQTLSANGNEEQSSSLVVEVLSATSDSSSNQCPSCLTVFSSVALLAEHVAMHRVPRRGSSKHRANVRNRPFKCLQCWKAFETEEKLRRHTLTHSEAVKPFVCEVCQQRFMNNSALSCHVKTHSRDKYYNCPLCHEGFEQINLLREHSVQHRDPVTGVYACPWCHKFFDSYNLARRHARVFHSQTTYTCPDCGKTFPRPDKLKLHQLKHSNHREFMCETCGSQFKRKDKLQDHLKRAHSEVKSKQSADGAVKCRRNTSDADRGNHFIPQIPPSDFEKFVFKCNDCQLGFRRRGMLVNHLAKRHPNIERSSVPELSLPIVHCQRDFYCQYCNKVYKSSSKRKAHIIKQHPGAELPAGAKRRGACLDTTSAGSTNHPAFSATVGSVLSNPFDCDYCHKQYASKAKLFQHIRHQHADAVLAQQQSSVDAAAALSTAQGSALVQVPGTDIYVDTSSGTASKLYMISRHVGDNTEIQILPQGVALPTVSGNDILTQAMAQSAVGGTEYRILAINSASDNGYATSLAQHDDRNDQSTAAAAVVTVEQSSAQLDLINQQVNHLSWNVLTGGGNFQTY